jgi:hypothetical protein
MFESLDMIAIAGQSDFFDVRRTTGCDRSGLPRQAAQFPIMEHHGAPVLAALDIAFNPEPGGDGCGKA